MDGLPDEGGIRIRGRRWRAIRAAVLLEEPTCRHCRERGKIVRAVEVDHIISVRAGGSNDHDNLQALCADCHKRKSNPRPSIGLDGWPSDDAPKRWGFSIPDDLLPSAIPVHLVCGAPGSGKTTYVREHAKPGDVVIDLDDILEAMGFERWTALPMQRMRAMAERDRMLRGLHTAKTGEAWLVATAASERERDAWREALGRVTVHPIETPLDVCAARVRAREAPPRVIRELLAAIDRYGAARGGERGRVSDV
jgi:predicted kinase